MSQRCRNCGGIAWYKDNDSSDMRCDDCIRRAEEDAMGPPEFVEGYRDYQRGKSKVLNPYWDGTVESEFHPAYEVWRSGWDYAKEQEK